MKRTTRMVLLQSLMGSGSGLAPIRSSGSSPGTMVQQQQRAAESSSNLHMIVLEPTTKETIERKSTKELNRSNEQQQHHNYEDDKWEIRLYNDHNNYEHYVAEQLVRVGDLSELQAFRCMKQADRAGEAILGEYTLESAEHYTQALLAKSLVVEMFPLGGDFQ